jgi:hypothetical protein
VGCTAVVTGLHYTGSVIQGFKFRTLEHTELTPVTLVLETPWKTYTVGGEPIKADRVVGFHTRSKGPLCDKCASNPHTITDRNGVKHQIVKTDPRPGWAYGETIIPVRETIRRGVGEG